jgi:glycerol uptake facilitator-like aquaporin
LADTFAGIAQLCVLPLVVAPVVGAALACAAVYVMWPRFLEVAEVVGRST